MLDGTLTGMYLTIQAAPPLLGPGASVVNLTTAAALRGRPDRAHDLAAKAGVLGLTRALSRELGPAGIRVKRGGHRPDRDSRRHPPYEILETVAAYA